jgi:hypothetical protein
VIVIAPQHFAWISASAQIAGVIALAHLAVVSEHSCSSLVAAFEHSVAEVPVCVIALPSLQIADGIVIAPLPDFAWSSARIECVAALDLGSEHLAVVPEHSGSAGVVAVVSDHLRSAGVAAVSEYLRSAGVVAAVSEHLRSAAVAAVSEYLRSAGVVAAASEHSRYRKITPLKSSHH